MMKERRTSDLIKEKINCFDLIDKFNLEAVRTADGSYRTYSFTHKGTNPTSMQIWKDNWYCHSSKMSGDSISMYAWLKHNGDNSLAFRDLMQMLGIGSNEEQAKEFKEYQDHVERIKLNVAQYHRNLTSEHRRYFHERKVTDEFIDTYKCGYDPASDRLIIPVWKNGQIVYWCARAFDDSKVDRATNPKYKKPSLMFNPSFENELYGFDTLGWNKDTLWVAEGVFDFISLYQEHKSVLCNATGMSNKHIDVVTKIAKDFRQVVICYDNDTSGQGFSSKLSKALFESGTPFKMIYIPNEYYTQRKDDPSRTERVQLKDISDAYCAGLMPDELLNTYARDGVASYLSKFDDYDELRSYLNPLVPYLSMKFKRSILDGVEQEFDKYCKKDCEQLLKRPKTQQEYALDFIKTYPNKLWYYDKLGLMFEFKEGYWQQTSELKLRKIFEDSNDVKNTEEKAIFDKIKVKSVDSSDPIPNEKECFNVLNGTIYFDINNPSNPWEFKNEHNELDYCTYCQQYEFNPNANDDLFYEITSKIFKNHPQGQKDMIERFEEYLGAIFIRLNVEQKMIMWVGNGANGKSVLNDLVQCLLGGADCNLYSAMGVQMLQKEFMPANLNGKLVQFFHDPKSDTYEAEAIMKQVISNDEITSNVKNKDPITFKPRALCFCDSNEMFHPKDKTDGWVRRFLGTTHYLYNRFTQNKKEVDDERVFLADNELSKKIREPKFLSSLLNHALRGYERVVRNGLKYSDITEDINVIQELHSAGNHLFRFALQFNFVKNGIHHESMLASTIYECYEEWYSEQRYAEKFKLSKDTFYKRIEQEFIRAGRSIEKTFDSDKRSIYVKLQDDHVTRTN